MTSDTGPEGPFRLPYKIIPVMLTDAETDQLLDFLGNGGNTVFIEAFIQHLLATIIVGINRPGSWEAGIVEKLYTPFDQENLDWYVQRTESRHRVIVRQIARDAGESDGKSED
jgi:hypothetical protein